MTVNVLLQTSDETLSYVRNDAVRWTREEGLASVESVQFADFPPRHQIPNLAQGSNIFTQFLQRMKNDFVAFSDLVDDLLAADDNDVNEHHLVRDEFNQRHFIIAATKSNKIYALDSQGGKTIWQVMFPISAKAVVLTANVYILRNALRGTPLMVYVVTTAQEVLLFPFNPLTGELVSEAGVAKTKLSVSALTSFILPVHDANGNHILAIVDSDLSVHLLPNTIESKQALAHHQQPIYFQLVDVAKGLVQGYRLSTDATATLLSQVAFNPEEEAIVAVSLKGSEPIASLGEALADRSVIYKYINPHSIAVATLSNYTKNAATLNVYIVNGIKGTVIDQSTHESVQGPIHIQHSENWVVYHYYNKEEKRYEMSVIELYDSHKPSTTHSVFSQSSPMVIRQSYILPSAVTAMGATVTQKGITFRNILLALPTGSLLSIPKRAIDARRPMDPVRAQNEGVPPYRPILPIAPQMSLNYNQTLARVRSIAATPSGLESTCLVFVSGIDILFTPVSPSKQFDQLSDDFNFIGLVLSLIALAAVAFTLSKWAARKTLTGLWA